jgi:hypothetical protein
MCHPSGFIYISQFPLYRHQIFLSHYKYKFNLNLTVTLTLTLHLHLPRLLYELGLCSEEAITPTVRVIPLANA